MKPYTSYLIPAALIITLGFQSIKVNADDTFNEDTAALFCEEDVTNLKLCTHISEEEIADPCKDQHELCGFWAEAGECDVNPNYMLSSCARSCDICPSFSNLEDDGDGEEDDDDEYDHEGNKIEDSLSKNNPNSEIRQKMNEHLTAYKKNPNTTSKMVKLCTNHLDKCIYYASEGLCEEKVVFMMENCPLACRMCDEIETFNKCVGMREPYSDPIFVNEDEYDIIMKNNGDDGLLDEVLEVHTVDSFFNSLSDKRHWSELGGEYIVSPLLSNDKGHDDKKDDVEGESAWMVSFNNFLSPTECQAVIDLGHEIGYQPSEESEDSTTTNTNTNSTPITRVSKNAKCFNAKDVCNNHSILSTIMKSIAQNTKIPLDHFDYPEIEVYSEGKEGFKKAGHHSFHHDSDLHESWSMAGRSVLSFYIPLLDVEKGGYLGFPALDYLMVPPRMGQMIVWPNVKSQDPEVRDDRMGKEILSVMKGNLYVLHVKAHQYSYKNAELRGCA